ncbi:MAG: S-adenosylmethionine:tRNA ribosyltransferase-isomerase [Actinomycetota bacterium]|nr:S-adenosylmethionine:tRNA ribosyltransferase-isomerase [Actinomycetota bacterium]
MSLAALERRSVTFELPTALEAREPPEARGLRRDQVRLMVGRRSDGAITDHLFCELPEILEPGDLVVINVSATVPAALTGRRSDGAAVKVHFATRAPALGERWRVIEVRSADGSSPASARSGERLALSGGATLELVAPYARSIRLMLARLDRATGSVDDYLTAHGSPIRYGYASGDWPLAAYQNVYAGAPGSAEMPSAGRPFTDALITRLVAKGILLAPLTLHTGVSSPERHEPPFPEWFSVPATTAALVRAAHTSGGRVIAVGTTVVRALESVVDPAGEICGGSGWTNRIITPENPPQVVQGLITGWHEPEASHLMMLEALTGPELLHHSYRAALARGYRWHEFGDSHLVLP